MQVYSYREPDVFKEIYNRTFNTEIHVKYQAYIFMYYV